MERTTKDQLGTWNLNEEIKGMDLIKPWECQNNQGNKIPWNKKFGLEINPNLQTPTRWFF